MNRRPSLWTVLCAVLAASLALLGGQVPVILADIHHDLSIHLDLNRRLLTGVDRIRFTPSEGLEALILNLAGRSWIQAVRLNGRSIPYDFDPAAQRLTIPAVSDWRGHILEIRYSCVFDDPVPAAPLNTDNPGYGVSGTISAHGVFILAGAYWYPQTAFDRSMSLAVEAPHGFLAVTSGDLIEHRDLDQQTLSRWHCDPIAEGLSLTAGPFTRRIQSMNGITAATYFSEALAHLSPTYLAAAIDYLNLYQELFGPYAFNQFAVVENFFPTGYGFPGYTVIGGRVLQLPFIPHTSLGHEIAHCWWGNGVLVDPRQGNWAEGLTSYVAEHLFKERASADAAREQRREWLRNFAALVPQENSMALADFSARIDPATKAIGYDKAAMVFHMLRHTVGEPLFWRTLRDIYAERRFQRTAWSDLLKAFETRSGLTLDAFFAQWITRAGAPQLMLEEIKTRRTPQGAWVVSGRLHQTEPAYRLAVPIQLTSGQTMVSRTLSLEGLSTDFEFRLDRPPEQLMVDPQTDLFRRLWPEELPVTINALRGAAAVRLSLATPGGAAETTALRTLQSALGAAAVDTATDPPDPLETDRALIQIGLPPEIAFWKTASPAFTLESDHFTVNGQSFSRERFSFFGVFGIEGLPVALFLPAGGPAVAERVAAKIIHYGNYSYLVFDGTRNQLKGVWPASDSPLRVNWPHDR